MIWLAGVWMEYTWATAKIQFVLEHSAISTQPSAKKRRKKHVFPQAKPYR